VRDGEGRLSKPNETRRNMGISTTPMSAFVSKRQQRCSPLDIAHGLASYIDLQNI
jgi:hypothetical protein